MKLQTGLCLISILQFSVYAHAISITEIKELDQIVFTEKFNKAKINGIRILGNRAIQKTTSASNVSTKIEKGDIIVSIDSNKIGNGSDFVKFINKADPSRTYKCRVHRKLIYKGKERKIIKVVKHKFATCRDILLKSIQTKRNKLYAYGNDLYDLRSVSTYDWNHIKVEHINIVHQGDEFYRYYILNDNGLPYVHVEAIVKSIDEISGITQWKHEDYPSNFYKSQLNYSIIKTKTSPPTGHLRFQYSGNDWLFIQSISVKLNEKIFNYKLSWTSDVSSDNSGGRVWEWHDRIVGNYEIDMIKTIFQTNKATIRFTGEKHYKNIEMPKIDIEKMRFIAAIKDLLNSRNNRKNPKDIAPLNKLNSTS